MRSKLKILLLILVASLSIFILGCENNSPEVEVTNLTIINNSGEDLKSIGYQSTDSSGGVSNADNSLISSGESVNMYMENNNFTLLITDENNNTYESQNFSLNFSNNKSYTIHIEKENNQFTFVRKNK